MDQEQPTQVQLRAARNEQQFRESKSPQMLKLERQQRKAKRQQPDMVRPANPVVQEAVQPQYHSTPMPQSQDEPWGKLQVVECPLEGYEGVRVWYRTNNKYGVGRNAPDATDNAAFPGWVGRFVKRVEWHFKKEVPDISTSDGFQEWENEIEDLLLWVIGDGYRAAKEQALGANFPSGA